MVGGLHRWLQRIGHDGPCVTATNRWRFPVWHGGSGGDVGDRQAVDPIEFNSASEEVYVNGV